MPFFQELFKKKYSGMYRGIVEEVNLSIKNGIYKVRVYPMMAETDVMKLPNAVSNLSTRWQHVQLKQGDVVWIFFENEDVNYPVIFDVCNIKDKYPKNISIDGTPVQYPNYDSLEFGKVQLSFDHEMGQLQIKTEAGDKILITNTGTMKLLSNLGGEIDIDSQVSIKTQASNLFEILNSVLNSLTTLQTVDAVSGSDVISPGTTSQIIKQMVNLNLMMK